MKPNELTELGKEWPEASHFRRSIRLEITLFVSGIILIMMLVTGFVISNQFVSTVTRNIAEKMLVQARSYSGPAGKLILATDGPDALLLNNICKKMTTDDPDIYWAGITSVDNVFIAHTEIKNVISATQMRIYESRQFDDLLREQEIFNIELDTIYISVPIYENTIMLGRLSVAASTQSIQAAQKTTTFIVVSITALIILLGIPLTMFVMHHELKPVKLITNHLKQIDFENIEIDIPLKNRDEFGFLAETLRVMGVNLKLAQNDLIEKERISRELDIAREIQGNLLPKTFPQMPECSIGAFYRSAKEVGGDYYDFIEFDQDNIGVLVADVSGKSLPGMLVMLLTRDIVKRICHQLLPPDVILCRLNQELLKNIKKGMFVTMFLGIFNRRSGKFSFASAGHNPLIRLDSKTGKCDLIKTAGYPLGMIAAAQFEKRIESREITLTENDWIFQYTDGINEAQNDAGEEYGLERFTAVLEEIKAGDAQDMIEKASREHAEFVKTAEQYDDITLVAIKWMGTKLNEVEITKNNAGIKVC